MSANSPQNCTACERISSPSHRAKIMMSSLLSIFTGIFTSGLHRKSRKSCSTTLVSALTAALSPSLSVVVTTEPLVVLHVIVFLAMPVRAVVGGHVVAPSPFGVQWKSLLGSFPFTAAIFVRCGFLLTSLSFRTPARTFVVIDVLAP